MQHLLKFGDGPTDAIMVDNAEWLDKLEYIPFLREVGRHFSVNRMLTMDSVKLRLDREQPMSFLEFNYSIMQAYDFVELYKRYGCRLQSCGSDQWGNVVSGIDLGRRMENVQLFGLTTPLITTSSGAKMGKTVAGAVWLNSRHAQRLRLLAVLAQHRGRRCRPLPAHLHRPAAGRDRAAGDAAGRRTERRQEDPRDRSDGGPARPRRRERRRRNRAPHVRGRRIRGRPADLLTRSCPMAFSNLAVRRDLASNSEARKLIANNGLRINDVAVSDPTADRC